MINGLEELIPRKFNRTVLMPMEMSFSVRASTRAIAPFGAVFCAFFIPTRPAESLNRRRPGWVLTVTKVLLGRHWIRTCGGRLSCLSWGADEMIGLSLAKRLGEGTLME
jgi:hypothetical protein